MIDLEKYKADIEAACQEYLLSRLELVGSGARDDFNESSDVDFLVTFNGDQHLFHRYFGLKERLENIFNRPVDLIEERAVRNRYVLNAFQKDRVMIYGA